MKHIIKNTIAVLTRKEKQQLAYLIVFTTFISIIDIASLALLVFIISFYTQPGFSVNVQPEWLFDKNSISLILIFVIFFILKNLAGYFITRLQNRFVYNVAARISEMNLLRYLEGTYADYVNTDSSVHIRKINQQPIEFSHYVLSGLQQIFSELVLITISIIAILMFNAGLFFLLMAILLPAVILLSVLTRRRLKTVRTNIKTTSEKTLQYLKEALAGFIESNIYDKKNFFSQRYMRYQRTLHTYFAQLQTVQGTPSRLIEVFAIVGLFILIAVNKLSGIGTAIDVFTIGAFIAAAYKIIPGIVRILNLSGQVKTYEFTIDDLIHKQTVSGKIDYELKEPSIESVQFNNVSFSNNNNAFVLDNFNLQLSKGDFVGLSGLSGKGKTTTINLLLGFLSPIKGEIRINNSNPSPNEKQSFWKNISYVKQQPFLIHDTILKNIVLGDDVYDEKKLKEAVTMSGLIEFSETEVIKPESLGVLNKLLSENGKNISGGQRQRIALARALYKDADLLILDEAFSELDDHSEQAILAQLKILAENGKIIVLITHNKDSLSFCTRIISLDEKK